MTILKRLEVELVQDWRKLQLEPSPSLKLAAIKAYYAKYALYRRTREWGYEVLSR